MEKRIHDVSNSPVVQGRTPIKRLGLSRKRKVSDSPCSLNIKIQSCGDLSPESSIPNDDKIRNVYEEYIDKNDVDLSSEEVKVENEQEALDYENEIKRIQERIEKKEKMLEKLKSDNTNIVELENLIEIWKNGCRNAYLHLTKLLNDRQGDDFNCKTWLKSVGIWNVMTKYFQNDYEISFSNDSE